MEVIVMMIGLLFFLVFISGEIIKELKLMRRELKDFSGAMKREFERTRCDY